MKPSKVMDELYKIKEELSRRHLSQSTDEWIRDSNQIAAKAAARLEDIRKRQSVAQL